MIGTTSYRRSSFACEDCPLEGPTLAKKQFVSKAHVENHIRETGHTVMETRTTVVAWKGSHRRSAEGNTKQKERK